MSCLPQLCQSSYTEYYSSWRKQPSFIPGHSCHHFAISHATTPYNTNNLQLTLFQPERTRSSTNAGKRRKRRHVLDVLANNNYSRSFVMKCKSKRKLLSLTSGIAEFATVHNPTLEHICIVLELFYNHLLHFQFTIEEGQSSSLGTSCQCFFNETFVFYILS